MISSFSTSRSRSRANWPGRGWASFPPDSASGSKRNALVARAATVRVLRRDRPQTIALPHPDYKPYNKSSPRLVYAPPRMPSIGATPARRCWRSEVGQLVSTRRGWAALLRARGPHLAIDFQPVEDALFAPRLHPRQRRALWLPAAGRGPRRIVLHSGMDAFAMVQPDSQVGDQPHEKHPEQGFRAIALPALGRAGSEAASRAPHDRSGRAGTAQARISAEAAESRRFG